MQLPATMEGGAIAANDGVTLQIFNSAFSTNSANFNSGFGGSVYLNNTKSAVFDSCLFTLGYAYCIQTYGSPLCLLSYLAGGAIFSVTSAFNVSNSIFRYNLAQRVTSIFLDII